MAITRRMISLVPLGHLRGNRSPAIRVHTAYARIVWRASAGLAGRLRLAGKMLRWIVDALVVTAVMTVRYGEVIWSHSPAVDVGSGLACDIDPRHPGYEAWGGPCGLRDAQGKDIGPHLRATGWASWWDGDLLRE